MEEALSVTQFGLQGFWAPRIWPPWAFNLAVSHSVMKKSENIIEISTIFRILEVSRHEIIHPLSGDLFKKIRNIGDIYEILSKNGKWEARMGDFFMKNCHFFWVMPFPPTLKIFLYLSFQFYLILNILILKYYKYNFTQKNCYNIKNYESSNIL